MSDHFSEEEIAAIRQQAEDLLSKLNLTDEEREWSDKQAKLIHDNVTDAHFSIGGEAYDRIRPIAAAAAVAYALITIQAWVLRCERGPSPQY